MRLIKELFENNKAFVENARYALNRTAKCIALKNKKVALIYCENSYYKLPGGKIERNENILTALSREVLEDIGYEISVAAFIGVTIEYLFIKGYIQICYAYAGHVTKTSKVEVTKKGSEKVMWVEIEEALKLLKESNPSNDEGKMDTERDYAILKELTR